MAPRPGALLRNFSSLVPDQPCSAQESCVTLPKIWAGYITSSVEADLKGKGSTMEPHEHSNYSHPPSPPQQEMSGADSSVPRPRIGSVHRPAIYRDPTMESNSQYSPLHPAATSAFTPSVVRPPSASSVPTVENESSTSHLSVPHPPSTAPITQTQTSTSNVSMASILGNGEGSANANIPKFNPVARSTHHHAAGAGYSSIDNSISSSTSCLNASENQAHHHGDKEGVQQKPQTCSRAQKSSQGPHFSSSEACGFDDFPLGKSPVGAGIEIGVVCPECGAVAVTSGSWNVHQAAHQGQGSVCPHCSLVFLTPHGRDLHLQQHRDPGTWEVDDFCECVLCGGSYIGVIYLELHLLELHGREALHDPRSFHVGLSRPNEEIDLPGEESGRQNYKCGICHSLFTFRLNLDCHMALHSDSSYGCIQCDMFFTSFDLLMDHCRLHRFSEVVSPTATFPSSHVPGPAHQAHRVTPHQPSTSHQPGWEVPGETSQAPALPRVGPEAACAHSGVGVSFPPSMLNYYMMMSLWGGDRGSASSTSGLDALPWMPYANSALTNVLNYFNPYVLNRDARTSLATSGEDNQIKEEKDSTMANSSSSSESNV